VKPCDTAGASASRDLAGGHVLLKKRDPTRVPGLSQEIPQCSRWSKAKTCNVEVGCRLGNRIREPLESCGSDFYLQALSNAPRDISRRLSDRCPHPFGGGHAVGSHLLLSFGALKPVFHPILPQRTRCDDYELMADAWQGCQHQGPGWIV
jgi:hypothetical protein